MKSDGAIGHGVVSFRPAMKAMLVGHAIVRAGARARRRADKLLTMGLGRQGVAFSCLNCPVGPGSFDSR